MESTVSAHQVLRAASVAASVLAFATIGAAQEPLVLAAPQTRIPAVHHLLPQLPVAHHPQQQPALPITSATALQGFSVVLVLGDTQASRPSDDVPSAARRALEDMRELLPFKSYRLLDTAWLAGSLPVRSASTKVRGPNNRDLELLIVANALVTVGPQQSDIAVKFSLADPGLQADAPPTLMNRARELERAMVVAEREISELQKASSPDTAAIARSRERLTLLRRQYEEAVRQIRAAEQGQGSAAGTPTRVIDTSFNMNVGETVVVGTSRIQGDTALIAVLTAVPRGGK